MQKILIVLLITLLSSVSFAAAPAVIFIEFKPIAAVSHGYSFGISEIMINKRTMYTLSFKKGKNVFAVTPENMLLGKYPELDYTGLAIDKNIAIIGGKESDKNGTSWVFMFDISKDKVKLLDIITKSQINEYIFKFDYQLPDINAPKPLEDIDADKIKEFGLDFYDYGILLYTEINKKRMSIDYKSPLYNKIFNQLDLISMKDEYQFMQYIIYGALAKRLNKNQAEQMYMSHIGESNHKLRQVITNMRRVKELTYSADMVNEMMGYFSRDIERDELFSIMASVNNKNEYIQRIELLDEQLKLLHIDEIVLNDFAAYIGGFITDGEFEYMLTKAVEPSYKNMKVLLSNIFILDNIIHKFGYKIVYLRADI